MLLRNYLNVTLITALACFAVFVIATTVFGNRQEQSGQNITATTTDNGGSQSVEEMSAEFLKGWADGQLYGLKVFNDPGLVNFYENNLQKVCPFYIPSGAIYRECVVTLEEKERTRLAKNPSAISTADKYCSQGAAKTADDTSLGFVDIYNTCMLYRLRKI